MKYLPSCDLHTHLRYININMSEEQQVIPHTPDSSNPSSSASTPSQSESRKRPLEHNEIESKSKKHQDNNKVFLSVYDEMMRVFEKFPQESNAGARQSQITMINLAATTVKLTMFQELDEPQKEVQRGTCRVPDGTSKPH